MSKIPHVKTPPRLMAQCCSEYEVLDIGENLTRSPIHRGRAKNLAGFTLIELMVVVVIVAIFAAIAIPSYAQYIERKDLAVVKQEAQKLASELERFKSKNYSYKGFDATYLYAGSYDRADGTLLLPIGSDANTAKYTLTLTENATGYKTLDQADTGLKWVITATRMDTTKQANNYDVMLNSDGLRCMTKTTGVIADADNGKPNKSFSSCSDVSADSEAW